ncbi:MAG: IS1380 family transposase [Proteobacteria bacterium]|nr:IS1380 family transposase [Pseudomonadota bacterium]
MPNPNCTGQDELNLGVIEFGRLGRREVQGCFDGGSMNSDAGVILLSAADRKIGLTAAAARCIADPRNPLLITHAVRDMLRQRVYGLALGWEDLNDHKALRCDVAMQTAVGVDREVASAPALCRLEKWADQATAVRLSELLVEQFIASFKAPPAVLVLDFDATDNPLHGQQEGRFFHGYYDYYCYLPLYVFCGQQLLCAYLRPSRIDAAQHSAAILKLLVRRLRQAWPTVRIILRDDSGFCRQRIINWCERAGVHYIIGLARNPKLEATVQYAQLAMRDEYERTAIKQRLVDEFSYAAQSWSHERRVITRLEWGAQGHNPRFVVTNLAGEAAALYDQLCCQRGEAENRIKEARVGLFATRTSCHVFASNQLRVLLAALAYVLIERMRALALQGTELASAQIDTLRIKLLKLVALVTRNTRRIRLYFASNWPSASIFAQAMRALGAT